MNDLPMVDTHLNFQHIHIFDNGKPLPEEKNFVPASQFEFYISPSTDLIPVKLKPNPYDLDPTFGLNFQDNDLPKRDFEKTIKPKYTASKIFSNPRSTKKKLRGAFVTSINVARVFTSADDLKKIRLLHRHGVLELSLNFALGNKLSFK